MDAAAPAHSHEPIPSRWPIITAVGAGLIPVGLVSWAHGWKQGLGVILAGTAMTLYGAGSWWAELLRDRFFGRDAIDAERRLTTAMFFFIGVTLHLGHSAVEKGRRDGVIASILMTVSLGAIFLCGQAYEYGFLNGSAFNIKSGIFGCTFFVLTGFHGLHVLLGLIFLNV